MSRMIRAALLAAVFVSSFALMASAGMMPVVSFAGVPSEFDAATPYRLDFTVMAHGVEPMPLAGAEVRFQGRNGEELSFPAESTGPGLWTVEVSLPEAGEWRMEVLTDGQLLQSFGTITVTAPEVGTGVPGALRVVLPIATVAAVVALVVQALATVRSQRVPPPASDVA